MWGSCREAYPLISSNVHLFRCDGQKELAEAQHRTISEYLSLQVLLDGCEKMDFECQGREKNIRFLE